MRLSRNKQRGMEKLSLHRRSLLGELETLGVRITAQRRALIEVIQTAEGHLDATMLLDAARKRDAHINRATVYRTVELLKKLGLIDELDLMHLTGEKHFYEVRTTVDHLHLACVECGRIEEFTSPLFERLKAEISLRNEFEIRVIRLEVGGCCKTCSKQHDNTAARGAASPG